MLLSLILGACAPEFLWNGQVRWFGDRGATYARQRDRQDFKAALETAREEIRDPQLGSNPLTTRYMALEALGNYGKYVVFQPSMDEEALRYYNEAMERIGDNQEFQAWFNQRLGWYYSKTNRNGLAAIFGKRHLDYYRKTNNTFESILGLNNLACVYADMGEIALRDYYRGEALNLARDYFRLSPSPSPRKTEEWILYSTVIKARMDNLAVSGASNEVWQWWTLLEAVTKEFLAPKYVNYLSAADLLSLSGDDNRARKVYQEAEMVWRDESASMRHRAHAARVGFTCTRASIELHARQFSIAAESWKQCLSGWSELNMAPGPADFRLAGLAYEGAGNLRGAQEAFEKSLTLLERVRDSYSVAERVGFFRIGPIRQSYWGLIRVLARMATRSGQEADTLAAIEATERVRARQLGDLLDSDQDGAISTLGLRELKKRLPQDTLVLDYVLTDEAIILLCLTRDRHGAWLIPYKKREFDGKLRRIAQAMATPTSDLESLHSGLSDISRTLLAPAADLLEGKKQILVLSDGTLNLIPFDLLTATPDVYRPIIQDVTVSVVPSLRVMQTVSESSPRSKTAGLAVLGDPVYCKAPQVAGLTAAELNSVMRGTGYLSYFAPLPETRKEVEAIARLFADEPVTVLLDTRATESQVVNLDLRSFRYLHFATHAILGGEVPGIGEPALVLGEEAGSDGFLKASEVEKLRLNADMTVLSAGKTGSGDAVQGEGVLSMSRAFLVAGSRAVVASLWSAEPKAAEDLMVAFYRRLRGGIGGAEALQQAKLEIMGSVDADNEGGRGIRVQSSMRSPSRLHPFYWAPFILVSR